ncbi:hypothetical protein X275_01290 [Marinitoga sp. 1197]|uniref:hypothetical protein n=1 Tax=Marinitoga sp. 1197 TaxID=1428449 RepID=UPI0006597D17|nr:hypothetical protein [Marinitoga sp. 1197]AJW76905.1 hypothetical protein UF08_16 [Marinitoga camini virus 1]KLO24052.1 hypothetical protein X275_01290 [Marinitoga sp. 1197]
MIDALKPTFALDVLESGDDSIFELVNLFDENGIIDKLAETVTNLIENSKK